MVDIEETVPNATQKQRNLEKLDKLRYHSHILSLSPSLTISDRATHQYRDIKTRQKDWKEIYNHKVVKEGLQQQAAR